MTIRESGEMYLETIYVLSKEKQDLRAIDVGTAMGFSKPSVSRALGILKKDGLITTDSTGYIKLTEKGEEKAKVIYERHILLSRMLTNIGVDEETAAEDACRIEHYISDKTFEAIKRHFKEHSAGGKAF